MHLYPLSLVIEQLHRVHSVPLAELKVANLGLHNNFWYRLVNVCIHEVTDRYDDPVLQER